MSKKLMKLGDIITFGKHSGKTVYDVMTEDVSYLEWLQDKTDRTDFSDDVKRTIREKIERSRKNLFPEEHSDWGMRDEE